MSCLLIGVEWKLFEGIRVVNSRSLVEYIDQQQGQPCILKADSSREDSLIRAHSLVDVLVPSAPVLLRQGQI